MTGDYFESSGGDLCAGGPPTPASPPLHDTRKQELYLLLRFLLLGLSEDPVPRVKPLLEDDDQEEVEKRGGKRDQRQRVDHAERWAGALWVST